MKSVHNYKKLQNRPWQDSNLQSPDSKSDALSIGPQGHVGQAIFTDIIVIFDLPQPI